MDADDDQSEVSIPGKKRKYNRGPDWTPEEETRLTTLCKDNQHILGVELRGGGSKGGEITAKSQHDIWDEITHKVNAIGNRKRNVDQMKAKWRKFEKLVNFIFLYKVKIYCMIYVVM